MIRESAKSIAVPVVRVTQPIGDFYVGAIGSRDLFEITYFDIRKILFEDGLDTYLGIQRQLNPKRVEEIRQYVRSADATFPTAVIVAVPESCVELSPIQRNGDRFFEMKLSNFPGPDDEEERVLFRQIARVIDGQHRIAGLEKYQDSNFEVNVSIFVGADIADQANIFATVNLNQSKVNRSLAYDLFEYSKSRSPEKTCHNIAVALDRTEGSPFYKKIKRLGVATEGRYNETLSQATVVQGILQYISANRIQVLQDRDIGRRGNRWPRVTPQQAEKLVLRPMFVEERDGEIANVIWEYFSAVQERWPRSWASSGRGVMLNKTNGFDALMRFFREAYLHIASPGTPVKKVEFLDVFSRINLEDRDFNIDRYVPGTSGAAKLYRDLRDLSGIEY
jgi:DGQHR domain-containing protein